MRENECISVIRLCILAIFILIGFVTFFALQGPAFLTIDPETLNENISQKDMQREIVKTFSITSIGRPLKEVEYNVISSSEGLKRDDYYLNYINNFINFINNKDVSIAEMNQLNYTILDLNSMLININLKILKLNLLDADKSKMAINLSTNLRNQIALVNLNIRTLNEKISNFNIKGVSVSKANYDDLNNSINDTRNQIEFLSYCLKTIEEKSEVQDLNVEQKILIKIEEVNHLQNDTKYYLMVKLMIPATLSKGEYKGEIRINEKGTKEELGSIPIRIKVSDISESEKQSNQSAIKKAAS